MSELQVCTQENLQKVLKKTKLALEEVFGEKLKAVILYGSYARGDQDEESDIDVMALVDIPKEDLFKYRTTAIITVDNIALDYDVFVSLKVQDIETFSKYEKALPYFQNVIREGIKVV